MAEFEAACEARGISVAVLPPNSPKMNAHVERMQANRRNEFHSVQDTEMNVTELNPPIERYLAIQNGERPRGSLDGLSPDKCLESQRIGENPPLQMS